MKGVESIRSLRQFDNTIVARYCGFRDADDYYYRAASARVVDRIAVPTLIIRAEDDPFVRLVPETRAALLCKSQRSAGRDAAWGSLCVSFARSRR